MLMHITEVARLAMFVSAFACGFAFGWRGMAAWLCGCLCSAFVVYAETRNWRSRP
jgi:hypothetical protein